MLALAMVSVLGTAGTGAPLRLVLEADVPPAENAPSATFDFDLLPEHTQTPEELAKANDIERSMHTRRTLLTLHQFFGFATIGLLATTVVLGQMNYYDKFSGQNTGKFEPWHDSFEAAATLSFATTGVLAFVAPVPLPKKNTTTMIVHKAAMLTATAGFVTEIILGVIAVSLEGHENQLTLAEAHLVTGYVTTAAVATGVGALFFP